MVKTLLIFGLILAGIVSVNAQSKSQLTKFAAEVTTAFSRGELASLDLKKRRHGNIRLVIDNSSVEPEIERFRFGSFRAMAGWFKKPENDFGAKVAWPLVKCAKGRCDFFRDGGILHNHFYLIGISYVYQNKRIYVKSIEILAG